jgi:hypothetical protein
MMASPAADPPFMFMANSDVHNRFVFWICENIDAVLRMVLKDSVIYKFTYFVRLF